MELIDTPNPNAKKVEADIQEDEVKKIFNILKIKVFNYLSYLYAVE